MRSAPPLAALALAVTVLLTGCVPQAPDIDPPPEPTSEPVFASDEEALAAATDAYKAYLAMSDLIAQEGGKNPERIAPFVTEEWLAEELHWSAEFAARQWRLIGNQTVKSSSLQQVYPDDSDLILVIYACVDLQGIEMVDESNLVVTPPELGSVLAQEITVVMNQSEELLVAGAETWTGGSSC